MKKINYNFLFPLIAVIIFVCALSNQLFEAPPLGKFLNPFLGAVQNGEKQTQGKTHSIYTNLKLSDSVNVFFDNRKVPHIFAKNSNDMYAAQGYVAASLRLWQMDFISYASAGRLSEIFKNGFLDYDRRKRRIGILEAAKKSLILIEKDQKTLDVLTAYTKGINAYISQLNYKNLPLEYKLLNYTPEPWSNLKTVLIMKNMSEMLTGYDDDLSASNMILALGEKKFNQLFPDFHEHMSPIIDNYSQNNIDSNSIVKKPDYLNYSFISASTVVQKSTYNPKLGSNNWAVSGKKTKSGFPILCNDPHLGLSLPSIWLEMQLSCPESNVYGVSIPGTPAIIIGFNQNIAWGVTNGADDVRDRYKLKISEDYKKYELDGKWLNLDYTIEEIKRVGQASFYDTIYRSIHGPIVINKSFPKRVELIDYALKWELHNSSSDITAFVKLNSAKNYQEFKEALANYSCPVQNFVFASKNNEIAIHHQGKMSIKPKGHGKFLLDGTQSKYIPTKYIPYDSLPQVYNPECGYVFSANQQPTHADYPYYYNGYYSTTRANQIKRMLSKETKFDVQTMKEMQLDNTNSFVVDALPKILKLVASEKMNKQQKNVLENLSSWHGTYNSDDKQANLIELWFKNIKEYTWDELKAYPFFTHYPEDYVLLDLIESNPKDMYFDVKGTPKIETAKTIITEAFIAAFTDNEKLKNEKKNTWSSNHKVNFLHLTQMPAFSMMKVPSAGTPEAINAISEGWGPSWRMIVELGDRPKAYGIYPGGQSGNIGSSNYTDFVMDWNRGKYYELQFFLSQDEAKKSAINTLTLK